MKAVPNEWFRVILSRCHGKEIFPMRFQANIRLPTLLDGLIQLIWDTSKDWFPWERLLQTVTGNPDPTFPLGDIWNRSIGSHLHFHPEELGYRFWFADLLLRSNNHQSIDLLISLPPHFSISLTLSLFHLSPPSQHICVCSLQKAKNTKDCINNRVDNKRKRFS